MIYDSELGFRAWNCQIDQTSINIYANDFNIPYNGLYVHYMGTWYTNMPISLTGYFKSKESISDTFKLFNINDVPVLIFRQNNAVSTC